MIIKNLENVDFSIIHKAFVEAFIDYGLPPMSEDELKQMVSRRGFDPKISYGAFDKNELVSFTLNGLGKWKGELTAYDTGTGTIKEYRAKGLAKRIFTESVPDLKALGIKQYLLEVLQHNNKAVGLYTKSGFKTVREFDYYVVNKIDYKTRMRHIDPSITIEPIDLPINPIANNFWDFEPAWQNSMDSVERSQHNFKALGAFYKNELVAYGIVELNTGDMTQIATHKKYRRQGIGTQLLQSMIEAIPGESFKFINTDKTCASIKKFLENLNIKPLGSQFEMLKEL